MLDVAGACSIEPMKSVVAIRESELAPLKAQNPAQTFPSFPTERRPEGKKRDRKAHAYSLSRLTTGIIALLFFSPSPVPLLLHYTIAIQ